MEVIWFFILIIWLISAVSKAANKNQKKQQQPQRPQPQSQQPVQPYFGQPYVIRQYMSEEGAGAPAWPAQNQDMSENCAKQGQIYKDSQGLYEGGSVEGQPDSEGTSSEGRTASDFTFRRPERIVGYDMEAPPEYSETEIKPTVKEQSDIYDQSTVYQTMNLSTCSITQGFIYAEILKRAPGKLPYTRNRY